MRVHEFMIHSDMERNDLTEISTISNHFASDITLTFQTDNTEHTVDVKSLLGMLLLPIKSGTTVRLLTKGKDEEEALNFVHGWFENKA